MRLNDSDAERVLAGEVPPGRADLTQVAAFLSTLPDTCPPAEVGPARDDHLYTVAREARLLAAAPPPRHRRNTRRLVVAAMAAGVGVLCTGVGVAAAVGANPLAFLPNLLPEPAISARLDTPASLDPSAAAPTGRPVPPTPTSQPQPGDTGTPGEPGREQSNNGKSDEAKSEHKPTPKPSHTNNARTNPPGQTKPDTPKPEKSEKPGSKQTQAAR